MEVKKVLYKKKILLTFLLLIVGYVLLFVWKANKPVDPYEFGGMFGQEEEDIAYSDYVAGIIKNAIKMEKLNIFAKKDSASMLNIAKTKKDYERVANLTLPSVDATGVEKLFEIDYYKIVLIIMAFVLGMTYVDAKKKELREMFYSMEKGRLSLAMRRVGALTLLNMVVAFLMMLVCICVSMAVYRYNIFALLGAPIQTLRMFWDFTIPISIGEFLCLQYVKTVIIMLLVSLGSWMLMTCNHYPMLGYAEMLCVVIVTRLLYTKIDANSPMNFLKYINIWYAFDEEKIFSNYLNLHLFGKMYSVPVAAGVVFVMILAIIILAAALSMTFTRPCKSSGAWIHMLISRTDKFVKQVRRLFAHHKTIVGQEIGKIVRYEKGWLVLILFFFICYQQLDQTPFQKSEFEVLYDDFVRDYQGVPSAESEKYMQEVRDEIQAADERYAMLAEQYAAGELSENDMLEASMWYDSFKQKKEFVQAIETQTANLAAVKETLGIEAWYVNQHSYMNIFRYNNKTLSLIAIVATALLCTNLFYFEKKRGIQDLLLSTGKGRGKLFASKMGAIGIMVSVVYIVQAVFDLILASTVFGVAGLQAPLQSLEFFSFITWRMSIGTFWLILLVARWIVYLCLGLIACHISALTTPLLSYGIVIAMVAPSIIGRITYSVPYWMYVEHYISISPFVIETRNVNYAIQALLGIIAATVALTILGYRRWVKKWN